MRGTGLNLGHVRAASWPIGMMIGSIILRYGRAMPLMI
jgi:hypothetical protein